MLMTIMMTKPYDYDEGIDDVCDDKHDNKHIVASAVPGASAMRFFFCSSNSGRCTIDMGSIYKTELPLGSTDHLIRDTELNI